MAVHKNLWLKNTKQRLAGVVFYNRAGETVSRELAAEVTNPRTQAQMAKRVKLANLVALYRANKGWLRNSAFEKKPRNWSVYNYLIHANLPQATAALTKEEAAAGACVAAPLFITQGSLPAVGYSVNNDGTSIITDIYVGSEFALNEGETTIGQLTQAILANNNGLVEGMQLSLVFNYQMTRPSTGTPYVVARYYELILNSNSSVILDDTDMGMHLFVEGMSSDNARLGFNPDSDASIWAAAVILSHTVGGKTYVSDADFTLNDTTVYTQYNNAAHVAEATASYGDQSYDFLSTAPGNNRESNANVNMPLGIVSVAGVAAGGTLLKSKIATPHQIALSGPLPEGLVVEELDYYAGENDKVVTTGFTVSGNSISAPAVDISSFNIQTITELYITISNGQDIGIKFHAPVNDGDGSQTE